MQVKTESKEALKFRVNSTEGLKQAFSAMNRALTGQPMLLTLQTEKEKRRNLQNRRYWAIVHDISDQLGFDADTWHEYFKRRFIGVRELRMPDGEIINLGMSSTDLSVAEFGDYMLCVEAWAVEKGVIFSEISVGL
jgi:hypothetical protein